MKTPYKFLMVLYSTTLCDIPLVSSLVLDKSLWKLDQFWLSDQKMEEGPFRGGMRGGRGGPGRGGPPRGRGFGDGMRGRGGRGGMMRGGPQGRGRVGPPRGGGMGRGGDRGGFGGPGGRGRGMGMRGRGDFGSRGDGHGGGFGGRGSRGMDRGRGGRGFDRGGRGGAPMGGDRYGPPPAKRGGMVPPQGGPMAKRGRFEGAQGANGYSAHSHPPSQYSGGAFEARGVTQVTSYPPPPITSAYGGEAGHNYQADGTGRHYDGSTEASAYGGNQAYGSGSQAYGGGGGYTSGAAGYEAGDYTAGGYSQAVPDAGTGYGPPPSTANSGYTQPDTYQSYSKPATAPETYGGGYSSGTGYNTTSGYDDRGYSTSTSTYETPGYGGGYGKPEYGGSSAGYSQSRDYGGQSQRRY